MFPALDKCLFLIPEFFLIVFERIIQLVDVELAVIISLEDGSHISV